MSTPKSPLSGMDLYNSSQGTTYMYPSANVSPMHESLAMVPVGHINVVRKECGNSPAVLTDHTTIEENCFEVGEGEKIEYVMEMKSGLKFSMFEGDENTTEGATMIHILKEKLIKKTFGFMDFTRLKCLLMEEADRGTLLEEINRLEHMRDYGQDPSITTEKINHGMIS